MSLLFLSLSLSHTATYTHNEPRSTSPHLSMWCHRVYASKRATIVPVVLQHCTVGATARPALIRHPRNEVYETASSSRLRVLHGCRCFRHLAREFGSSSFSSQSCNGSHQKNVTSAPEPWLPATCLQRLLAFKGLYRSDNESSSGRKRPGRDPALNLLEWGYILLCLSLGRGKSCPVPQHQQQLLQKTTYSENGSAFGLYQRVSRPSISP